MKTKFLHASLLTSAVFLSVNAGASAETFKVGYIGGFTGALAFYDGSHLEGVQLAVDEINAAGGIDGKLKIELMTRDMRSEAAETAVMAQELLAAGVHAVIAPCDADPTIATGQIFSGQMTPVITTCSTAPTTALLGGPNVFLSYPADNVQAAALATIAAKAGYKTALTVSSKDTVYTDKLPVYFIKSFEKLGGTSAGNIEFKVGQPDFNAEVTKIKSLNPQPDVIMTAAYEPDFPSFIKALRAAGVTTPILEVDGIDSPTTYALGDVVDGVVFTNGGYPTPGSPLEAFNKAYEAKYGKQSETIYNANGYDIIKTFEAAVKAAAGNLEGAALTDAINNLAELNLAKGETTYRDFNRIPIAGIAVNKIEGGKKNYIDHLLPDLSLIAQPE